MHINIVEHPILKVRLGQLRDRTSSRTVFKQSLDDITRILLVEATKQISIVTKKLNTPIIETDGYEFETKLVFIPVLRAGLGMLTSVHALIPEAEVGFVGMARNEETTLATVFYEALAPDLSNHKVFILDPMLATGGSMLKTVDLLVERGAKDICIISVVAAPDGIEAIKKHKHISEIFLASIDEKLNQDSYIVPGLGDAGDRQFGPKT